MSSTKVSIQWAHSDQIVQPLNVPPNVPFGT